MYCYLRNHEAFLMDFLLKVGLPIHFPLISWHVVLACGKDTGISVSII